jgi:DNA-binding transcriptional ArsR family regulator
MSEARLDAVFHALADPTRRSILSRLARGEATVQDLTERLPMSQPAVSKHLKVLEEAGLVERRRDAQRRWCRLRGEPLRDVASWAAALEAYWQESYERLDELLEEEKARERKR